MLLAGLLATTSKARVCLIGEPWSPYRLPRRLDLSVAPVTRPETWSLLQRETPEVLRLLGSIGRGLFERVDPLFVAETPQSADRLGHMRWIAAATGYAAERAAEPAIAANGSLCRIRDAALLVSGRIEPVLEEWVRRVGVEWLPLRGTAVATRRDGTATLTIDGVTREAATLVLADDEAILTHQPVAERHRLLATVRQATVVSEPALRSLPAPLIAWLDRQVVIHQRTPRGPLTALAGGEAETVLPRLGASTATLGPLRRTGQAIYRVIETVDGAPLIGRTGRHRVTVIAGLGPGAAFIAPAVARLLAGRSSATERAWFEPRDISRAARRQSVAEIAPVGSPA